MGAKPYPSVGTIAKANVKIGKAKGINPCGLFERLARELDAKVTRTKALKGHVREIGELPPGYRIICETEHETLIQWDETAWTVSQAARMDAQKLFGMYPAEKHEHSGPDGGAIEVGGEALERVITKYLSSE